MDRIHLKSVKVISSKFNSIVEIKDTRILTHGRGDAQGLQSDYPSGAITYLADLWGCLQPSSAPVRCVTDRVAGVAPKVAAGGLGCCASQQLAEWAHVTSV